MEQMSYETRYHEALAKAFAASALNVRRAYFDLAEFYLEKVERQVLYPSHSDLNHCLARSQQPS